MKNEQRHFGSISSNIRCKYYMTRSLSNSWVNFSIFYEKITVSTCDFDRKNWIMDFFFKLYFSFFTSTMYLVHTYFFFDVCLKRILPELLQQPQLPLMNAMMWRTNPCTAKSLMRPLRPQQLHGPDKTWLKGPLDYRLMEDMIELVFEVLHGDLKTKPV